MSWPMLPGDRIAMRGGRDRLAPPMIGSPSRKESIRMDKPTAVYEEEFRRRVEGPSTTSLRQLLEEPPENLKVDINAFLWTNLPSS